jgi:hypothetical protein
MPAYGELQARRVAASAFSRHFGFVTQRTGGLELYGFADHYCADRATKTIGAGIVRGDSEKHSISVNVTDSGSTIAGAAS